VLPLSLDNRLRGFRRGRRRPKTTKLTTGAGSEVLRIWSCSETSIEYVRVDCDSDSEPVLMQSPRYSYVELDVHKSRFRRRRRSRRRRCGAAAVAERVRHVMT